MNLEVACERLVRYLEDHRDDFRDKPQKTSWFQYLSTDVYAKKMLAEITSQARILMKTKEHVKEMHDEYLIISNRNHSEHGFLPNHRATIAAIGPSEQHPVWANGAVVIDVVMSTRYTASVRVLFG